MTESAVTKIAILALTLFGLIAVTLIMLRGGDGVGTHIATILAFVAPTVAALLALLRTEEGNTKIDQVGKLVNGRMSDLLAKAEEAAKEKAWREFSDKFMKDKGTE
jgi:hypothetical protein